MKPHPDSAGALAAKTSDLLAVHMPLAVASSAAVNGCHAVRHAPWAQVPQTLPSHGRKHRISHRTYVHPCVIDGNPSLVYEAGLDKHDPEAFRHLRRIAQAAGLCLFEERRRQDTAISGERRKRWALVLSITLGVIPGPSATASGFAEPTIAPEHETTASGTEMQSAAGTTFGLVEHRLGLIPAGRRLASRFRPGLWGDGQALSRAITATDDESNGKGRKEAARDDSERLAELLEAHHDRRPEDPSSLRSDLEEMAAYYSRFPETTELLSILGDQPWRLVFQPNTWATRASGTPVSVNSVMIFFDPRKAARLRFRRTCGEERACTVSPADALLHELLHARIMLLEPDRFIAEGGMSSVLYPYAHEAGVIRAENSLYAAMQKRDGVPRPQRAPHRHVGALVDASCVLCTD